MSEILIHRDDGRTSRLSYERHLVTLMYTTLPFSVARVSKDFR
jgi:hypothetical protein